MDIFGVMLFLNYFLGSSIILSNLLGFAHFLGNIAVDSQNHSDFSDLPIYNLSFIS